jgi:ATP-dependent DNA helicase UvrD/PcrA
MSGYHWQERGYVAMEIAPALQDEFERLNEDQRAIVSHEEGQLLVIAGPGSGKTRSLTLLAMNLLLCEKAQPEQLVLCTYTEKAARELLDRMLLLAEQVSYQGDVSQMRIGTIHSICRRIINEHLHHTPFGNDYELLNHFTQRLLIFRNLQQLCSPDAFRLFLQSWDTPWKVANKLQFYFNTITEELIFEKLRDAFPDPQHCKTHPDNIKYYVTKAYHRYRALLVKANSLDFAFILKCAYNLLEKPDTRQRIIANIHYVLVDEYQDTNYIQEKILTCLASGREAHNLIVIGDEDQALYRFRGATVRNILTFQENFPTCQEVRLTINYRSHPKIVDTYNQWMQEFDWSNPDPYGPRLRTDKIIRANTLQQYEEYPAVSTLTGMNILDEAEQFAELVMMLKVQGKIADYSEVALLLHSVRYNGGAYIQALEQRGIPSYSPRGRSFFLQPEIQLMIGGLARILGYNQGEEAPGRDEDFTQALDICLFMMQEQCNLFPTLEEEFQAIIEEILWAGDNDERNLADYFYRLIFLPPFADFLSKESKQANLVLFSGLLRTFQKYFEYQTITFLELELIKADFLDNFLAFLHVEGLNEEEDQHQPLLPGHVQVMTIYQAKGLEFPVVVVGRLDNPLKNTQRERKDLQSYYHHVQYEPESRIAGCDLRRLYYVAFSRPQNLLILSASRQAHTQFTGIWKNLPQFAYLNDSLLTMPTLSRARANYRPRPHYGFTTHYQTYQLCPRRYHFFYDQRFVPSRTRNAFRGQLVHQTIERLHYVALEKRLDLFDETQLQEIFTKIYDILQRTNKRSLSEAEQKQAYSHVLNYYQHNQHKLKNIRNAEHAVQIEHDNYVVNGKIDVLIDGAAGLEILDFKTHTNHSEDPSWFSLYQQQLYFYASAVLRKQRDTVPLRLSLYWTAEENLAEALVEIPYHPDDLQKTEYILHETITQIQQQQFAVLEPPSQTVCASCDIRALCRREHIIG